MFIIASWIVMILQPCNNCYFIFNPGMYASALSGISGFVCNIYDFLTTIHLNFRCIDFNRKNLLLEYILFCSVMYLKVK